MLMLTLKDKGSNIMVQNKMPIYILQWFMHKNENLYQNYYFELAKSQE